MKFILISKKENFQPNMINDSILNSTNATSLKSFKCIKKAMSNFILYLYPHNEIYEEQSGKFYNLNGEEISFINGLVTCPETNDEDNIENIFKALKNNKRILGDFQALNLKKMEMVIL